MKCASPVLLAVLFTSCASNPEDWAPVPVPGGGVAAREEAPAEEEATAEPAVAEPEKKPEVAETAAEPPAGTGFEFASVTVPAGGNYPTAEAASGFTGRVVSPYNGQMVDVRGIPSGTLVADPRFPEEEKKFFRVP